MPAEKKIQINLLPQEQFASSALGRILHWALTSFRVIVVLTEMMVMAAFLSRFWLDAKNSDLNEQISQKQAVILSAKEIEEKFRLDQERLAIYRQTLAAPSLPAYVDTLVSCLPETVTLTSLALNQGQAEITGVAGNEAEISQFIANLKAKENISAVKITQAASDSENASLTDFGLNLMINGQ
jgi:Tfp pilus assembly protein PilN